MSNLPVPGSFRIGGSPPPRALRPGADSSISQRHSLQPSPTSPPDAVHSTAAAMGALSDLSDVDDLELLQEISQENDDADLEDEGDDTVSDTITEDSSTNRTSAQRRDEIHNNLANADPSIQPCIQWQDLEYSRPVCDTLLCAICKSAFFKPVTTTACDHTFCSSCLDTYLSAKSDLHEAPCPMCRTTLRFSSSAQSTLVAQVSRPCNRIIDELLDRCTVKCPNHDGACDWHGPRSSLEKHIQLECDYTLLACSDPKCSQKTTRGSALLRKGCLHHEEECRFCRSRIDLCQLHYHLQNICTVYQKSCEACGKRIARDQHLTHTEACWDTLAPCEYANDGCSVATSRRHIARHVESCIYGTIQRLDARLTISESTTEKMRRENQWIQQELLGTIEDLVAMQRRHKKLRVELQRTKEELLLTQRDQETWSKVTGPGLLASFGELEKRMSELARELFRQGSIQSQYLNSEMAQWKQELIETQGQVGGLAMQLRRLLDYQNRQRQSPASGLPGAAGSAADMSGMGSDRESRPAVTESRSRASSNEPRPSL